jgi:alkaline phosphatase
MNRYFFSAIIYLLAVSVANSQPAKYTIANVHAHNDYQYNVPFTQAYALKIGSIEADVFLVHDTLFVAHHIEEIRRDVLFETAYLQKLDQMVREHSGYAYGDSLSVLQLLIDIKTDSLQTLDAVIKSIRKFPLLVNNRSIRFVITGNQTPAEQFAGYPSFILFDGKINDLSHRHQLNRIGIYSANFAIYRPQISSP